MDFPLKLPDNKPFDAVGFGLNAVDHLIVVPEYPAFDTKIRLLAHKQSAGGQTASAMVALQRLGLKTAYAGRFGSDPEGLFGLETLKEDGVNVDYAQVVDGATNQIAFITIDALAPRLAWMLSRLFVGTFSAFLASQRSTSSQLPSSSGTGLVVRDFRLGR